LHVLIAPLDKFDAELFLQILNLRRKRGLRYGAVPCSNAEMAEARKSFEVAELSEGRHDY
jgi:hypothetical protein